MQIASATSSRTRKVCEQKMFSGLAFPVRDKMVVCVGTGKRALLVRVDGAHHAVMGRDR
ncbi:hypothetical protein MTX35_08380 [Rhodococcus sp. ARC_M12]|uniref:Uncharacterized protein n=1 Tax=Rhodococcus navarretei TaxID=3128981 RepID=A0ABU9CRE4_9NOCA|nr:MULTISPECIES: hypothetical protein [unclassified Rhodococcus (in: high G+C Gram-positive bacteria)]MCJ0891355.1 hypothetical protein [Rhodococcus sp. ARC_M5]MCJ0977716.1 hypothetical protein [Rhodococcus sp. ARC_M12]